MVNVLRQNRRNLDDLYASSTSKAKKYYTNFEETISMIAGLLKTCYGGEKAMLARRTDFSELARCKMKEEDVAWKVMLGSRKDLQEWVNAQVSKGELWTPPSSKELDLMEEAEILQVSGGQVDLEEEHGDGASDDDDDIPLMDLVKEKKKHQVQYWLKESKPMKGESEDDYAERCMHIIGRGTSDQKQLGKGKGKKASDGGSMDYSVGTMARKYFETLRGHASERKPTRIVDHRDCGDVRGTISSWFQNWK